jgi:iron complex outermembrane receptor protein
MSAPAGAQEAPAAPAAPEAVLPTITVTGEKMGRSLDKTLTSTSINTSRDLQEHADETLTDVMARTPGVSTAPDNQTFSIRGAPVAGLGEQGPNDLISVYVDGAVQSRQTVTLGTLSVWDMEQVEILRGPQSTVQGRNAMAGAIVLQSKNPSFAPTFSAQGRLGKYGEQGGAFVVGGGVVPEKVAVRLAVEHQEDDGYIRNDTLNKDANARRSLTARGKLLWLPNDSLDVLFTLAHTDHRRGNPVVAQSNGQPLFYRVFTNADAFDTMRQNTATTQIDYRISPVWTLTSVTSVTGTQYDALLDFDQTDTPPVDEVFRDHQQRLASQEVRLAYQKGTVRGHAGAYLGRSDERRDDRLALDGITALTLHGDTRVRNKALFGELNWDFAPRWQLITGLRYDKERNRTASHFDSDPDTVTLATYDAVLPKVGVSYQAGENHLLGVVVQRGYRGGGSAFNIATAQAVPFEPEYTTNYEFSYRGHWLDKRLQTNANVYLTNPADANSAQVANAGRSRMRGLELSLTYDLNKAMRFYGGAAYNHTRYLSFVTSTQDLSGQAFERAPRTQFNVGMRWRNAKGWLVNLEATRQSASNSEYITDTDPLSPTYRQVQGVRRGDAATLVNASVQYRTGRWLTTAYVKNLLDKDYAVSRPTGVILTTGAPRTLGVAVRYDL